MEQKLNLPLKKLESIELNILEKTFKINEKDFAAGCFAFAIECDSVEGWKVTLNTDDGIYSNTFNSKGKQIYKH